MKCETWDQDPPLTGANEGSAADLPRAARNTFGPRDHRKRSRTSTNRKKNDETAKPSSDAREMPTQYA
jgi:hypothetical protein